MPVLLFSFDWDLMFLLLMITPLLFWENLTIAYKYHKLLHNISPWQQHC